METKHLRMKQYELPEGAMPYDQLTDAYRACITKRDALRAECEALRAALEMYQRAMLAAAQNHALSSQERAAYENAQLALSQGGRK